MKSEKEIRDIQVRFYKALKESLANNESVDKYNTIIDYTDVLEWVLGEREHFIDMVLWAERGEEDGKKG